MSELIARSLIDTLMSRGHLYVMQWRGTKIPRGATIGGAEVGWAQHGIISGKQGQKLGYYKRDIQFGGPGEDFHQIRICTDTETEVVSPSGEVCHPTWRSDEKTD